RMAVLAALDCVNFVLPFSEDTPLELIKKVRPDFLVKGGDWTPDAIVGATEVRAYGGQVVSIPIRFQRSTTELIAELKSAS
ncbi:MAG: D-glycero-beta-D-manno-heptose 1-phosphate adenylyltransferase, partial [Gammaproteobacteria bacterium]|nr:D-glycero-beta-D-manno-heptose 1-phosphate adenylyltransferase [Gammaproteobacteria bacterium]